ncbi:MAG: acid phosphatase [Streblomastix strix]|uniref:Acid phosphatase n=1 Tax=Streblomastix strix TaxID=222440 RepID=A0A5J4WCC4_9EUKA|nr:MAG: acid phosphatase [Streblomastix strix]
MFLILLTVLWSLEAKLVLVQAITRHGDRGPLLKIPGLTPYGEIEQLTILGMKQQISLGKMLRDHYGGSDGIIPQKFNTSLVYARASLFNRTFLSAYSLLNGLFPNQGTPNNMQVIPIQEEAKQDEYVMRGFDVCQTCNDNYAQYKKSSEYQQLNQSLTDSFAFVSEKLNYTVNMDNLEHVWDAMFIETIHGNLSEDLIPHMKKFEEVVELTRIHYFEGDNNEWAKAANGISFREFFFDNVEQSPKNNYRFKLYSGHDSTILSVMRTLGYDIRVTPYYAAIILIELHEDEQISRSNKKKDPYRYFRFFYQPDEQSARDGQLWEPFWPVQCGKQNNKKYAINNNININDDQNITKFNCPLETLQKGTKSIIFPHKYELDYFREKICVQVEYFVPPQKIKYNGIHPHILYPFMSIFAIISFGSAIIIVMVVFHMIWTRRKRLAQQNVGVNNFVYEQFAAGTIEEPQ